MLTLAQLLTQSPVDALPDPPLLDRLVFENPWILVISLIAIGIVAFVVLNRLNKAKNGVIVAVACAALAGIVFGLSMLVTTQREVLRNQTLALIEATARADVARIDPMLFSSVSITVIPGVPGFAGKDAILAGVDQYLGKTYPLREHSTSRVQAVLDGTNVARTQVRVWARLNPGAIAYDAPIGSWWRIDWRRDPVPGGAPDAFGEWRVTRLTLMQLDGMSRQP